ncbi:MAG: MucB/RseB C-terminal domain-containing protein [Nitrosomonadales bacterium]|nr:MucB/RseB C-terminal domain-containing protein [Nitrosomonadales bacterium]
MKPAWFLAVALWACAPAASADPLWQDDLNWLKTMVVAARQTDYSGIFVYQYDNHVETFHISHVIDHEGEHSRLNGMDGARREIIRKNDQVWCYLGDGKAKRVGRSGDRRFPAILPEQLSLLNENYQIKQTEEGRVAGFHAHAVVFKPRDVLRYGHRMWAHSDSGLLLKAEVLDERGRVIEQNTFTTLTLGGNVDRSWINANRLDSAPPDQAAHLEDPPEVESLAGASGWQVGLLPPGFKKVIEMRRPLRGKKGPATHMVFSDGMASISVFIETLDGDRDGGHPGLSSRGAMQVYSKVSGDYLLTVVGEVPPRTVMQVADSVRYSGQ